MNKKNVGIRYVFKRFDKDNDAFISYGEFTNCLKQDNVVPSFKKQSDDLIESIFEIKIIFVFNFLNKNIIIRFIRLVR